MIRENGSSELPRKVRFFVVFETHFVPRKTLDLGCLKRSALARFPVPRFRGLFLFFLHSSFFLLLGSFGTCFRVLIASTSQAVKIRED